MSNQRQKMLLVTSNKNAYTSISNLLAEIEGAQFELDWMDSYEAAEKLVDCWQHDIYLIDYFLGSRNGLELLGKAINKGCMAPFILLIEEEDKALDIAALEAGAADCLVKQRLNTFLLDHAIRYALKHAQSVTTLYESDERYRQLVEERNLLRTLIDNLQDQVYVKGVQGEFLLTNLAHAHHLKIKIPGKLIGKTDFDFYPNDVARQHFTDEQAIIKSGRPLINREEASLNYRTGEQMWTLTTKVPLLDSSGQIVGLVGSSRNITDRKHLEQQIRESLERRRHEVQTSTEIAQEIAAAPGLDVLFRSVVDLVQKQLGYYHVQVYTIEVITTSSLKPSPPINKEDSPPGSHYLVMQAGSGKAGRMMKAAGHKIPLTAKKSLVARAAQSGEPVLIPDVFQEPDWLPNALLLKTKSEISLPIKLGDEVQGVLDVQSSITGGLTEEDRLLLMGLCGQIAVAIDYRRAETALACRAEEMTALYRTSLEINAKLEVATLLQIVVRRATTLLDMEMGTFSLVKPDKNVLEVVATHNQPDNYIGLSVQFGEGIAGRIAQTGEPMMVTDYHNWPGRLDSFSNESIGRILGVPLKQGNQVIGVLSVFDEKTGEFDDDKIQLLSLFATYISIVIQNARLFEAEQDQREFAEILGEVAKVVNSSLKLNKVLDRVLFELEKIMAYDAAHIMFLEHENTQLVAARHFIDQDDAIGSFLPLTALPFSAKTIRRRQPLLIPDTHQEPLFNPVVRGSVPVRCLMLIPLISRADVIGILSVISYTPHYYSTKDLAVVFRFAQQVVVGIENARLYEQVQLYNAELEQRVIERTVELETAQERLIRQERLAVLGQLAGSVAHELRNPLGVISNAVYFLKMIFSEADETTMEYLDIINTRIRESEKIVSDLLDLSRIRAAQRSEVKLFELINRVLERHPPPKHIRVTTTVAQELPATFVDDQQIGQVLSNLVINAYQAMSTRGQLTFKAWIKEQQIFLTITDTGEGMTPEVIQKIFEPLFSTKVHGIGLGLAVSKNLLEVNGGNIEVESVEGQGSTFTIALPIKTTLNT